VRNFLSMLCFHSGLEENGWLLGADGLIEGPWIRDFSLVSYREKSDGGGMGRQTNKNGPEDHLRREGAGSDLYVKCGVVAFVGRTGGEG
jgi:hypothetical protein